MLCYAMLCYDVMHGACTIMYTHSTSHHIACCYLLTNNNYNNNDDEEEDAYCCVVVWSDAAWNLLDTPWLEGRQLVRYVDMDERKIQTRREVAN